MPAFLVALLSPRWPRRLALALLAPASLLAEPAPADATLLQAAVIITTFDRLNAGCAHAGGYSTPQRQHVLRWQASQSVDGLRARLPELLRNARLAMHLDRSAQQIAQMARSQGATDCTAAVTLTQLPDAQIGRTAGSSHAAPLAEPALPPTSPSTSAPTSAPPAADSRVTAATLAQIDSFGFATRPKMGAGGFIALDIYPVVLFKSGDLLTDVRGLRDAGGLAAHRAAHGDRWTRWRREGGQLQWLKSGQWAKLPFNATYARLPDDLRLTGRYRSTSGVGNVAAGGQQAVTWVDDYRFSPDGSVLRSATAGSTAQAGGTTVATRGGPGERAGRYRVDGLQLRIDYEDGSHEQRVLIKDPQAAGGTLWLDGESYVERR